MKQGADSSHCHPGLRSNTGTRASRTRGSQRSGRDDSQNKRRARHRRGMHAELIALLYLMLKGYLPLAWRYKTPVGEIDLILKRGRTVIFVEVKARRTHSDAAFAIHAQNQSRVVRAAQYYLASHPIALHEKVRFDVCLIAWYRPPMHRTDAFQSHS